MLLSSLVFCFSLHVVVRVLKLKQKIDLIMERKDEIDRERVQREEEYEETRKQRLQERVAYQEVMERRAEERRAKREASDTQVLLPTVSALLSPLTCDNARVTDGGPVAFCAAQRADTQTEDRLC